MKFSIVIPVYNVEKYLYQCLDSILNQTFEDYEIIIVDDGSIDSSGDICDEYSKTNACIKVFHQANKGQGAARNKGIESAQGEYLLFLDSDDYYVETSAFEKIAQAAEGCDIVSFNWSFHDEIDDPKRKRNVQRASLIERNYKDGYMFLFEMLKKNPIYPWYPWLYAIKREFWKKNNFHFMENVKFEDVELMYRVLIKAQIVHTIPALVYAYRRFRSGSTTTTAKLTSILDLFHHVQKNIDEVKSNQEIPQKLKRALCNRFAIVYYDIFATFPSIKSDEREDFISALKQYRWLTDYKAYGIKKTAKRILVKIGGVRFVCWMQLILQEIMIYKDIIR